jgi:hypothetical protein
MNTVDRKKESFFFANFADGKNDLDHFKIHYVLTTEYEAIST